MENNKNNTAKPAIEKNAALSSSKTTLHSSIQAQGQQGRVKDAPSNHWVYRTLPKSLWPYAQLARFDRPIGWKLLMWPCFWALALAVAARHNGLIVDSALIIKMVYYLFLFWIGSMAMRGAGCTWNDLVDHKIDAMVERTRSRPLPSHQVSRKQAKIFMLLQALLGLVVLLQFNWFSVFLGLSSLLIVALYPFMKRYTNWPQFFLGLAFNFGVLIGYAVIYARLDWPALFLYIGAILWTIGYDTIYAHQDKEDDALVGVRSTARLFGDKTKSALFVLYSGFVVFAALAFYSAHISIFAYIALALAALHMLYQIKIIDINNDEQCLKLFKSNSTIGLILFIGLIISAIGV